MKLFFVALLVLMGACVHQSGFRGKDWDAREYRNNSGSQLRAAEHALKRIALRGNESVLDIGCGDGKITAEIAEKVLDGQVLGVDLSEKMIAFATNSFFDRRNLRFLRMSALDIDFDKAFDVVVSFSAIQWVSDQDRVFANVLRSLRPNGAFVMVIPAGYPEALQKSLDEMMADARWKDSFRQFKLGQTFQTHDAYEAMLRRHGFHQVSVELIPAYDRFETIDGFKRFVRQWLPHLTPIPAEQHEEFLAELMHRYEMHQGIEADGSIWFNKMSIEAIGKKM